MNAMKKPALMMTVVTLLWAAAPDTQPQAATSVPANDTAGDEITLNLGPDGMPLPEFARVYRELTGRNAVFVSRELESVRIDSQSGPLNFRRGGAVEVLETLLLAHDIAVVDQQSSNLDLVRFQAVRTALNLKRDMRQVSLKELETVGPAELVTCVLPLKNVSADGVQRLLCCFVQEHRSGFVSPHAESNSLIISNFARAVRSQVRIAMDLDAIGTWTPNAEKPAESGR